MDRLLNNWKHVDLDFCQHVLTTINDIDVYSMVSNELIRQQRHVSLM